MFDVGFSELVLLAVVALVVLGPEKLPHAARMAGAWLGRIRRAMTNIQMEIEKEVSAQEMRDRINQEIERLKSSQAAFTDEVHQVENTIRQSVDESSNTFDTPPNVEPVEVIAPEPLLETNVAPPSPPVILEKPPTP
jgi:sec-independent protein translocase protein TatB